MCPKYDCIDTNTVFDHIRSLFVPSTTELVPNMNVYVINVKVFVSHMTVFINNEYYKQGSGVNYSLDTDVP